jgi:hypothetical protein
MRTSAVAHAQLAGILTVILQLALQQTTALSVMLVGTEPRGALHLSALVRVHQGGSRWQTQLLAQQETIAFSVLNGSTSQPVEAIKLRIASFATRVDTAQQVVLHPSAQVSVRLVDTRCPTQARVRVKTTVSV